MVNKKKTPTSSESDSQTYSGVGVVFFVVGMALLLPEGTRAVGLPFLILGFTFFILGQQKPSKKRKK